MQDDNHIVRELAGTLESLVDPVQELLDQALVADVLPVVVERGFFRPSEDEQLAHWLARYLSIRGELWSIIECIDKHAGVPLTGLRTDSHWRCFVIAFSAACLLVRIDRFFLFELANDKLIQKKLNQSFKEYRLAPKSYTRILDRFTNPKLALKLYEAMWLVRLRKSKLQGYLDDDVVGVFVAQLPVFQTYLDPSKRHYLRRTQYFLIHGIRRKFASAKQKSMFAVLEKLGRATSELSLDIEKQVSDDVRARAQETLKPGDVLVTRHNYALSNFFLPGVWPHAALFIGSQAQRDELDISFTSKLPSTDPAIVSTFEALKDGVKLRPLSETLHVDSFIILRPNLSQASIKSGIQRVLKHEGKRYNFDFDFFRSDRLVCTEVIYRAFDGLENIVFELTNRAGRQTLSAEDLLDMALDTEAFDVIGLYGYPKKMPTIIKGRRALELLEESYRITG